MNQIEAAVTLSRTLETILVDKFNATGKGLHEKVTSAERFLPADLVRQIRYIATIRNAVVHEDGYQMSNVPEFISTAEAAAKVLTEMPVTAVNIPDATGYNEYTRAQWWAYRAFVLLGIILGGLAGWHTSGWGFAAATGVGGGLLAFYSVMWFSLDWLKGLIRFLGSMVIVGLMMATVVTIIYVLTN